MKIIVIEGIDGSGKSTIAQGITKYLKSCGINAEYVHFPTEDSYMGSHIYDYLNGKCNTDFKSMNYMSQYMLYALDRFEFFEANKERFKNSLIICDRYTTSSMIYQGLGFFLHNLKTFNKIIENIEIEDYIDLSKDNRKQIDFIKNVLLDENIKLSEKLEKFLSNRDNKNCFNFIKKMYTSQLDCRSSVLNFDSFIKLIEDTEYITFGLPRPEKVYYISKQSEEIKSTTNDCFEEDKDFQDMLSIMALHLLDREKWSYNVNFKDNIGLTIRNIAMDIVKNIPLSIRYNINFSEIVDMDGIVTTNE